MTDPLTIATTAAGAWAWDKYGKAWVDKLSQTGQNKWKKFGWKKAAKSYKEKVAHLYGTTRILGQPKPVPLEGIFTDVFVLDKPTAFRRFDITELKHHFEQHPFSAPYAERHPGLPFIRHKDNQRLFILGKPRAGKTTFLRYIALQAVEGDLDKVPIFVSLKEWSDSDLNLNLRLFINKEFEICNFPEADLFIEYMLAEG